MEIEYKYPRGRKNKSKTLEVMIILFFIIFVIAETRSPINSSNTSHEAFSPKWIQKMVEISLACGFCLICLMFTNTEAKKYQKWIEFMRNNSIKYEGYVKQIRYIATDKYELIICYSNMVKKDIEYMTTVFLYNVDPSKKILCTVYENREQKDTQDYIINQAPETIQIEQTNIHTEKTIMQRRTQPVYTKSWYENRIALDFRYER